jgi:hypothetical protein
LSPFFAAMPSHALTPSRRAALVCVVVLRSRWISPLLQGDPPCHLDQRSKPGFISIGGEFLPDDAQRSFLSQNLLPLRPLGDQPIQLVPSIPTPMATGQQSRIHAVRDRQGLFEARRLSTGVDRDVSTARRKASRDWRQGLEWAYLVSLPGDARKGPVEAGATRFILAKSPQGAVRSASCHSRTSSPTW